MKCHVVFGPHRIIFFSGITQRPVLQEKGPPRRAGVLQIGPEVERTRDDEGAVVGCQSGLRPRDTPLRHTQVYHPLCLAIGEFALDFFRISGDLT